MKPKTNILVCVFSYYERKTPFCYAGTSCLPEEFFLYTVKNGHLIMKVAIWNLIYDSDTQPKLFILTQYTP